MAFAGMLARFLARAAEALRGFLFQVVWSGRFPRHQEDYLLNRTLRVRHENQGQVSVIEIAAGGTARRNLGALRSYSSGDR